MVEGISSMEVQSQSQKVVLAHDASKGVRVNSVKWLLDGFMLKAGDMFILLPVVYQIQHPMGYMMRIDSSMFGVNQKAVDDEVAARKREYEGNLELVEVSKLYETRKVDFKIEFVVGPIPKIVVLEASKKLHATWLILDRRMKRDEKYFLERLCCGISTMKCNNAIIKVRGPKLPRIPNQTKHLPANEMLHVDDKISTGKTKNDEEFFTIEIKTSCTSSTSTRTSISDKGMLTAGNNQENSTTDATCDYVKTLPTPEENYAEEATCDHVETLPAPEENSAGEATSDHVETLPAPEENSAGEATGDHVEILPAPEENSAGEAIALVTCDHIETLPTPEENAQLDQNKCVACNSTRPPNEWQSRNFSYMDLAEATNRFSPENLIHRGETEVCYHGIIKELKLNVIVKEQKDVTKYKSELQALVKTRHENVILFLGTCSENRRLLVFEYACSGSLDQHLSRQNSRPPLTWLERLNIAMGTSRGLSHLHGKNIIHRDIRPKNILLTHDFLPLISGFGLASMENESQDSSNYNIIGTLGYLAPEYEERGKATTKTDVYAFGMILLQLVTGLSPTDRRLEGRSLIKWGTSLLQERKFSEFVDPGIEYDPKQLVNIVRLALKCVRKDPYRRLSMEEAMYILEYIKDEKASCKGQRGGETEEVKVNGDLETVGQSEYDFEYNGMMLKQAKHFYQGS